MSDVVLELDGLGRDYGERVALDGVTLTLDEGETLVVFGPNGAGKSTLLRILATLLRPHRGTAKLLGSALPDDAWEVRGKIGFLGHEALLYRDLTPRENLRHHARLHRVPEARVMALLEQVQMERRADDPVRTLSRGMVQRVAVCRSVLHGPPLLLLDEPTANLDPAAAELVDPLVGNGSGRTRVLTSHDPAGGLEGADQVLGLKRGRVELSGPAAGVAVDTIRELYR